MQHSEFVNSTVKAIKIYLNLDKLVYIAFVPINLAVAMQSWILFRVNRQFKKWIEVWKLSIKVCLTKILNFYMSISRVNVN